MTLRMPTLTVTLATLLVVVLGGVSARELSGVLRYHTEGLSRANYAPSYGHLCNNTQCIQEKRHPVVHPPVLSLDELERRQRVAALHRQYISSQQYRPHPQPFDVHPPRPLRYPQHLAHPVHNGSTRRDKMPPAAPLDIAHSNHEHQLRRSNHRRNKRNKKHRSAGNGSVNDIRIGVASVAAAVAVAPRSHGHRNPASTTVRVYKMAHSRVSYEYGVPGLSASLSFRVSPTSPPYSSHRVPACENYISHQTGQATLDKPNSHSTSSSSSTPAGHCSSPANRTGGNFLQTHGHHQRHSNLHESGPIQCKVDVDDKTPVPSSAESVSLPQNTVRVIRVNNTCIRCPRRQLARAPRNQLLARVPRPKLRFCSRPDDSVTDFPLMVLRGPRMGAYVGEGDYTIVFKTLVPLPAKTCRYTLQVYSLRCPPLPPAQHGSFECTNGHLWGSRCHLRCEPGFHLRGLGTAYGYLLNQPNVTATFKCVKRKRQAIWKTPNFQPICTDKTSFSQATTELPLITTVSPKKQAGSAPTPPKRRVSCRWPKEPLHGWANCGQRGRWKKRLFVREHLPCFRGCDPGFEPSIALNTDGKKNRISCVGGSWVGFQDFQCESRQEGIWKKCREKAEGNKHVVCTNDANGMRCRIECPPGFVVPKRHRTNMELDCSSGDVDGPTAWPVCQSVVKPLLVDECKNQVVENATFPVDVEIPQYRPGTAEAGPIEVNCNVTVIQQYGEFAVSCTAIDLQLDSRAECTFTVFSPASSCRPFEPGPHVDTNCAMPSGLEIGSIGHDSLPLGAQCEFFCETGYTLPTSRLKDSYTTCQKNGTWTVTDLDLCKPLGDTESKRHCENQTFIVEEIPPEGIRLELPEYLDSLGDIMDPVCSQKYATEYGETTVSCDFDDYEVRTRSNCVFYVTVRKP